MDYFVSHYKLKDRSIKEPDSYLGVQVSKLYIDGADDPEKPQWVMPLEKYVKHAVTNVKTELASVDQCLPTRVMTPMSQGYRPELDQSKEIDLKCAQYYQSLISVLRWICELGWIDILVAVSMLLRCVVLPRQGHLQQVFHIFAYLKHHKQSKMVLTWNRYLMNQVSRFVTGQSHTRMLKKLYLTTHLRNVVTVSLHHVLLILIMLTAKLHTGCVLVCYFM